MIVSDYIVSFFENLNVDTVFMVTGGGCMHLTNSFGNSKKIKYICPHHEQSAAMAGEAYAKMKNDIGLVVVTSGPGGANTITGVLGSYQDSTPCIFISGQAKRKQTQYNAGIKELRQFGAQEANITKIVESITKYSIMINDPNSIKYHLEKAVHLAKTGRPGPVWLDIPLDVQNATIIKNELYSFEPNELENFVPKIEVSSINKIKELLKISRRPVIIAGHGIRLSGAQNEFYELVNELKIPVVTPMMGIDVIPSDSVCNIGRVGIKGTRAGNFAMQNADLILSLGSRLAVPVVGHEYELFAREAKVVVVDICKEEHEKRTIKIDYFVHGDVQEFISKILKETNDIDSNIYDDWSKHCLNLKEKYPVCLPEYDDDTNGINYYKFIDVLTKRTNSSTPIISDAGSSFYAVAQGVNIKNGQRFITSGAMGTMGFGLPAAIGVCFANDRKNVVTITGDGSFNQNPQELAVLKMHNLPVKVFITNNSGYLSIRQTQRKFFNGNLVGESESSGLFFPDLKKLSEAYDLPYIYIDTLDALNKQLDYILNEDGPVVVEVKLLENQEIIPTNASKMNDDGTMVSMPLEDMYPFLDRDEFEAAMKIKPVNR